MELPWIAIGGIELCKTFLDLSRGIGVMIEVARSGGLMSAWVVLGTYSSAAIVALLLLYFFEPVRWYWHVLATLLAIGMGLAPIPAEWAKPQSDLMVGWLFSLLFVWGVAAPLFRRFHHVHAHS